MTGSRRLLLAAALCAVSLGLGWSASTGDLQVNSTFLPGSCTTDYDGYMSCTTGTVGFYYTPGYGYTNRGYADDARIVLVPAAVGLAWAAQRRSRRSEWVVRIAVVALVLVALRAGVDGQISGALVGVVAAVLAASALRSSPTALPMTRAGGSPGAPRSPAAPAAGPTPAPAGGSF